MKPFHQLLINTLITATKNNFVWFALTYWIYLETRSVISTGTIGGIFLITSATSSFWLGAIVDHHKKKIAMLGSSIVTLILFSLGTLLYLTTPKEAFTSLTSPVLWVFVFVMLCGVLAGSIYYIAMPTLITILVPEEEHAKANGLFGTISGISFAITSVASGLVLGFLGMIWVLVVCIVFSIIALIHLAFLDIPEKDIVHTEETKAKKVDIKGTIKVIRSIPGLFPLIFYATFNNFLGGVFMALMDAYGLTLVSVQVWGLLWGALSLGFIVGGLYISKKGLGAKPLRTMFRINLIVWTTCIFFVIQPSIVLVAIGMLIWLCLMPFIEATEQTIMQKVVPFERQGRVFGFAHSIEQMASPLTAFFIGPIAQLIFIPFMTTGKGVTLIGDWFGVGPGRGIALVFIMAGFVGLTVTLLTMRSNPYKLLAKKYEE